MAMLKPNDIRSIELNQGLWVVRAAKALEKDSRDHKSWMHMYYALLDLKHSEFKSSEIGRNRTWKNEPVIVQSVARTAMHFGWEGMNALEDGKIENAIMYTERSGLLFFFLGDFQSSKDQLFSAKLLQENYAAQKPQGYDHEFSLQVKNDVEKYIKLIETLEPLHAQEKIVKGKISFDASMAHDLAIDSLIMLISSQN